MAAAFAYVLITWSGIRTVGVADLGVYDAVELIEKLLHTPEAAACQIDCFHVVDLHRCSFHNRSSYNDHAGYDVGIMTAQYCGAAVI